MNKLFIYISFTILGIFATTSCDDYLEEDPPSLVSLEEINEENLEGLVIGAYEPFTRSRGRIWETNFLIALTLLEESSRGGNNGLDLFAQYEFLPGTGAYTGYNSAWPTLYEAIGRANILLSNLPENENVPDAQKQSAIGEASFVRAIAYYNLTRAWGSLPLRLIPISGTADVGQPLAPVDEIYNQIIEDLKVAEANLPDVTSNFGRATAGAAKVALADVYLTRGQFQEARDKAKEVIDNASTYGYALLPVYSTIFSPTADTNSEDVFSLKFTQAIGQGNFINTNFAPAKPADFAKRAGIAARGLKRTGADASSPLIANWDDNDLRKAWNIYDQIEIDGEILEPLASDFPRDTEFYYGKYRDPNAVEETAAGNDFYLYRYADALLIFAEAENQVNGPTTEAYDAVNQIRRRAYGVDLTTADTSVDFPGNLSKEAFDDLLFRERGYEFMAEGKRWFDLVRTGRWATIIPEAGKPVPMQLTWEIPNSEIENNPALGN